MLCININLPLYGIYIRQDKHTQRQKQNKNTHTDDNLPTIVDIVFPRKLSGETTGSFPLLNFLVNKIKTVKLLMNSFL